LTSVFQPYSGEKINMPEFLAKDAFLEAIHKSKFKPLPTGYKKLNDRDIIQFNQDPQSRSWMAIQEKGKRASCALPYELYVDGKLSSNKKSLEVRFFAGKDIFGQASAGSPFTVYAPGKYVKAGQPGDITWEDLRTWAYAVEAGDQLTDVWPLEEFDQGIYHLRVYGPNGFYRELKGSATDPSLEATCGYERAAANSKTLTGDLTCTVRSAGGTAPYECEIVDNAYQTNGHSWTLQAGSTNTITLHLGRSFGWYDFTLRVKGFDGFEQRFAGRVETGKPSFSDPFMGREIVG
jgi:phospholipase C